jgi:hypothetical protein
MAGAYQALQRPLLLVGAELVPPRLKLVCEVDPPHLASISPTL